MTTCERFSPGNPVFPSQLLNTISLYTFFSFLFGRPFSCLQQSYTLLSRTLFKHFKWTWELKSYHLQVCICRKEGGGLHRHLAFLPEDSLDGKNSASTRFSQKLTYANYCAPFFAVKTSSKNSFSEVFREKRMR